MSETDNYELLITAAESRVLEAIAQSVIPFSQRAQALLAVDAGSTMEQAADVAGLKFTQVRYWVGRFRKSRLQVFSADLLNDIEAMLYEQEKQESEAQKPAAQKKTGKSSAGKRNKTASGAGKKAVKKQKETKKKKTDKSKAKKKKSDKSKDRKKGNLKKAEKSKGKKSKKKKSGKKK